LELPLRRLRSGVGDALEETERGCGAAGSDQDGKKALARFLENLHSVEAVGESRVHAMKLASGSASCVPGWAEETAEENCEGGLSDAVGARDGPSPVGGVVSKTFCYATEDLPGGRGKDVVAVSLVASVVFLEVDGTEKVSADVNEIGKRLAEGWFHRRSVR
jgi:hypothetical protein